MKKLIIIFLFIICLGGCYDYNEINDLAIVVGIGIDYKDEAFEVTYEILSDNQDKEAANIKGYTISGQDKILAKALDNASDRIPKKAYYSHADLVLLSENVAKNHFEEISDYLIRSNYIRDNFNVVITKDPKEVLSTKQDNLPVISSSINDAIKSDKNSGGYSMQKEYADILREILTFGCDTSIPIVDVKNNKVYLEGIALFRDYEMINTLDKEKTAIINVINNNINKTVLDKEYDEKIFSLSLIGTNIKLNVTEDTIKVEGSVNAKILNNQPNFEIKDSQVVNKIEKDFAKQLNNKITEVIKELQQYDSDILYLAQKYYNKTRIKNDTLWQNAKIESNVSITIAKKGLIYEVQNAN